jgi:hypothetical protein
MWIINSAETFLPYLEVVVLLLTIFLLLPLQLALAALSIVHKVLEVLLALKEWRDR